MKTLYSKKVDFFRSGKLFIPGHDIYFSSTKDYTPQEAEIEIKRRIVEKWNYILQRLRKRFKARLSMKVTKYDVDKITVDKEEDGIILTNRGAISSKIAIILEI